MDRRRRRAAVLILALAGGAAAAEAPPAPLRAARWIASDDKAAQVLSHAPTECLKPATTPETALSVEVGRAAFRNPLLLGGQAGRAGVACESCHREGRGNPHFQFPGVSGAPGTADVTSSLFSTHRGNGIDDPKPIPDLSGPKAALKISQVPGDPALETFIRGLVVEEFDGRPPPPAVLKGLADYVRALGPDACPAAAERPATLAGVLDDARRAVAAAEALLAKGDAGAAVATIGAARSQLRLIEERYASPALARQRAHLREADSALAAIAADIRAGRPDAARGLARWRTDLPTLAAELAPSEAASLFNPKHLDEALNHRLPG